MHSEGGIDWYSLSKMNTDSFDLQQFNQLLSVKHPEQGIDRVTTHYRKKLLLMFQNASKNMKQQLPNLLATQSELTVKRIVVAEQLQTLEAGVESSFKEISNLKLILSQKKRLKNKLMEKLNKKGLIKQKKVYCCSICGREDFTSAELLRNHNDRQHGQFNASRGGVGQVGELKDLLMTMKDKEIEMMSMFLQASRQFQTQKLEHQYANEYNKFANQSGKTDQSLQQPQELKSESQFLFFQRSEQFRREMERDQEFRRKLSKEKTQRQTLNTQFYQKGNYYNVFGAVPENKSIDVENLNIERRGPTLRTEQSAQKTEQNISENYGYYDHNEVISKFLKKNENLSRDSRFSLVENTPKPYIQTRDARGNYKDGIYSAQLISDRLTQPQHKSSTQIQTMFGTKRKFYQDTGYVFNSGPLQDDQGGDSDYQDYFGKNAKLNISIQDQEIKVNFHSKTGQTGSKQSFHLSKMLSPKENSSNSILDKSLKDKSSVIVDLSDSFSKRDFEISKDDETINLSDLKLSKLQKRKQQEKIAKLKESNRKEQNQSNVSNSFTKLNKQNAIISTPQSDKQMSKTTEIHILKQFQKAPVVPLREEQYRFAKDNTQINMFTKSNDRVNVLGGTVQSNRGSENNFGILNEFLRQEFKGESNTQPKSRRRTSELQQFINK